MVVWDGTHSGAMALDGVGVRSVLSAELFREFAGLASAGADELAAACQARWIALADALAALAEPLEFFLVLGSAGGPDGAGRVSRTAFLAAGRGDTPEEARQTCARHAATLRTLLETTLDYAELEPLEGDNLGDAAAHLRRPHGVELRRRQESIGSVAGAHGAVERVPGGSGRIGFRPAPAAPAPPAEREPGEDVRHLFAWTPGPDSWRRLLDVLEDEPAGAALVVHARGWREAPPACLDEARAALTAAEGALMMDESDEGGGSAGLPADAAREEALARFTLLQNRALALRVFVTGPAPLSDALLATVEGSLDDPAAGARLGPRLRGGARRLPAATDDVLGSLDAPALDLLFAPAEACAALRTPLPSEAEMPGLPLRRARTALLTGTSGDDAPLGDAVHRGRRVPVALDGPMRFRHTYILGQTGTGKSTLLQNMVLHDIRAGRGVCLLDPHGSLIDKVLRRYPKERAEDLVLVDVTDLERPVGFNVLRLTETDPAAYRAARDLVIDDLYAWIDRTYDLAKTGGPMFESHFRGMLGLLMGLEPPPETHIPSLMAFRSLYVNKELRERALARIKDRDPMTEEFVAEATAASGEAALPNMAGYVTSKFTRFVSDAALRNMTCQKTMLDFDDVVNSGKVLLFYLGKGRFGDQAAGLLAGQVVSRIRQAVMSRGAGGDRRPFYLYADEFQLFADGRFSELLAEARKFRLSLTLAHQYVEQLPREVLSGVLGNVGTVISLRTGPHDAEVMAPLFAPTFGPRDLVSLPNFRAYARSFGQLGPTPFSLEVRPTEGAGSEQIAAALRQLSRLKYGRDRELVEAEIRLTHRAFQQGWPAEERRPPRPSPAPSPPASPPAAPACSSLLTGIADKRHFAVPPGREFVLAGEGDPEERTLRTLDDLSEAINLCDPETFARHVTTSRTGWSRRSANRNWPPTCANTRRPCA